MIMVGFVFKLLLFSYCGNKRRLAPKKLAIAEVWQTAFWLFCHSWPTAALVAIALC
jgi:hypothetical protein